MNSAGKANSPAFQGETMDIFFSKDTVLLGVAAPDKWRLIDSMVSKLVAQGFLGGEQDASRELLSENVRIREEERATGLGEGFAFPHGRIPGISRAGLCMAITANPVDFGAPDGKPARMVCLMLVPEEQPQVLLKVMSAFARVMTDPIARRMLTRMDDEELIAAFIVEKVLNNGTHVTARDIMRPPSTTVRPDASLHEVTRMMSQRMLESVAVTEEDGTLLGHITCDRLFQLGMPDFFSQLKSVSFIREFDPFEKYFTEESNALARDAMTSDFATVPEDATLLEIVFELAVRHRQKLYVVRDGKRVGVIDRSLVLDRVINI